MKMYFILVDLTYPKFNFAIDEAEKQVFQHIAIFGYFSSFFLIPRTNHDLHPNLPTLQYHIFWLEKTFYLLFFALFLQYSVLSKNIQF